MTWNVDRQGEVIYVDLGSVETAEWEAVLDAINAEMVSPPAQVVIRAGERPPGSREALVQGLVSTVRAQGVKVRVIFD
jgi:fructose-1-phosphate kinase PfkB-like protein